MHNAKVICEIAAHLFSFFVPRSPYTAYLNPLEFMFWSYCHYMEIIWVVCIWLKIWHNLIKTEEPQKATCWFCNNCWKLVLQRHRDADQCNIIIEFKTFILGLQFKISSGYKIQCTWQGLKQGQGKGQYNRWPIM